VFDYTTQRKFIMRKYVLPTLVSLALSSSLAFADNQITDAGAMVPPPPPAMPDMTPPPPPPAMPADMKPPEPPKYYQEMMAKQKAQMEKQRAQMEKHQAEMMAKQKAQMEKHQAQMKKQREQMQEVQKLVQQLHQANDPKERRRLMDEMQQRQQKMHEQMMKENGMTPPPAYAPRQGYAPNWNRSQHPQYGYRNMPRRSSMMQHRAKMEERVGNIEKKLDEILKLLKATK